MCAAQYRMIPWFVYLLNSHAHSHKGGLGSLDVHEMSRDGDTCKMRFLAERFLVGELMLSNEFFIVF